MVAAALSISVFRKTELLGEMQRILALMLGVFAVAVAALKAMCGAIH